MPFKYSHHHLWKENSYQTKNELSSLHPKGIWDWAWAGICKQRWAARSADISSSTETRLGQEWAAFPDAMQVRGDNNQPSPKSLWSPPISSICPPLLNLMDSFCWKKKKKKAQQILQVKSEPLCKAEGRIWPWPALPISSSKGTQQLLNEQKQRLHY